jgi:hypothetical protein
MTRLAPFEVDPCVNAPTISASDEVSTFGSCFAQHIGRFIKSSGLNYFTPECGAAGLSPEELIRSNYGVFSGRYGNIYTAGQLLQLFDRAFDSFHPVDDIWKLNDYYVDAFRPQIQPNGFPDKASLLLDRQIHLSHVRDIFIKSKYIIFTLGLTESWRSKVDGAIYPIPPGISGGHFDPSKYEFVNFSPSQVEEHLNCFLMKLKNINPHVNVILTVSPVPLIATYENRHVLSSTTYSKAALRVAADAIERKHKHVNYFPSYEIITSPTAQGRYFMDDLRSVTESGVNHVMRIFRKHYIISNSNFNNINTLDKNNISTDVKCDEDLIELSLNRLSN